MRVRFTRRALRDIARIDDYIAEQSPDAASRIVAHLIDRSRQLADNPFEGRETDEPTARVIIEPRLRYFIFYTITEQEIQINYIRHTSRRRPSGWNR